MRRADREITLREELLSIMEGCDVCRLALNGDDGYPYLLPLNFGLEDDGERLTLYFHGANEGTKYRLLARDNRVSFEMDCAHRLHTDVERGYCTMEYESVMGRGFVDILPEEEKYPALKKLMAHYHREAFAFNPAAIPRTTVLRLTVTQLTGKRRKVRQP